MLYYNRIDLSKGIDISKSSNSKEYIVCLYWYFRHGSKSRKSIFDCCHDLLMLFLNISVVIVTSVKVHLHYIFFANHFFNYAPVC